jgi:uncharacterized hydrophobic protein (TIGR00271 family)
VNGRLNDILFDGGAKTTSLDGVEEQLFLLTRDSGKDRLVRYTVLLTLSAVIATGGILVDSTATVIGAMIVAPLATPILAIGLAITIVHPRQVGRSTSILAMSVVFVIAIGFILTLLLPVAVNADTNSQVSGRVSPNLIDLLIAIATGLVGGFAITRSDLAGVLPGVAIAISLVPPLAVVGVVLAGADYRQAFGAFLLFLSNAIAMVGAGALVFAIAGYHKAARGSRAQVKRPILIISFIGGLLIVLLGLASAQSVAQAVEIRRINVAATQWLEDSSYQLVAVRPAPNGFVIEVIGSGNLPDTGVFYDTFEPVLWFDPVLEIRRITGTQELLPEPEE